MGAEGAVHANSWYLLNDDRKADVALSIMQKEAATVLTKCEGCN